jgi:hypothetical protein
MKRITALLLLTALLGIATMELTANAAPLPKSTPCLERSWIPRTGMPTAEWRWRTVRTVDCAVRRWWPGAGHTKAVLDVAWRESHYWPFAFNRTGCAGYGCLGTFQQHAAYWPGRRDAWLRPAWFRTWPISWHNSRAAIIVAVRMFAANDGPCPDWC